jgi:hypothetical protein
VTYIAEARVVLRVSTVAPNFSSSERTWNLKNRDGRLQELDAVE